MPQATFLKDSFVPCGNRGFRRVKLSREENEESLGCLKSCLMRFLALSVIL